MSIDIKNHDLFKKIEGLLRGSHPSDVSMYVDYMNMEIVVHSSAGVWRVKYTPPKKGISQ